MAGGGGSEPNLTPFIDLFSVLVCFLLMTAAWLQLESLQVQVEKAPSSAVNPEQPQENNLDQPKDKKVKLSIKIFSDKIIASEDETEIAQFAQSQDLNQGPLASILSSWQQKFPNRKDVILNSDSSVTYGQLIKTYDFLVAKEWSEVGINPY